MIKIKDLNKFYNKGKNNEIHVINEATFELPTTGLVSFLGPSGSGKTTLLNVIGGLDKAKGSINYDGLELENYKMRKVDQFRRNEIGYVFQNYNLLLEETVYSNLAIALEMIGIFDKEEQDKRIEYTLKAVGMYKYRKKRAYALSGGQQQRVSIARALVKRAKIIIADEPTGNLDNENTIEVMNILKKISKTSLVLMVTHNEEVANFYSDQVIKIRDGKIIESYTCEGGDVLHTEQNNTIYLKDLNLTEEKGELVSLRYYTSQEAKPLDIRIVEKNGTYYITSNEKLKLVEETNIKLIDDHYQALKQESLEKFEYDTSWYNDGKKRDNVFKRIWRALVKSFNKMRFAKKRAKFLYGCFFVIGMLLAISVIGYSNYRIVDDSTIVADKNFDTLVAEDLTSYAILKGTMQDLVEEEKVEYVVTPVSFSVSYSERYNFKESIEFSYYISVIPYQDIQKTGYLAGGKPGAGEIVISKNFADDFIKEYGYYYDSYEELIGKKLKCQTSKVPSLVISGVSENPYNLGYVDEAVYMETFKRSYMRENDAERFYSIEKKLSTYTMVAGRDLTEEDLGTENILITTNYTNAMDKLDKTVIISNRKFYVVGICEFKDYAVASDTYIIHSEQLSKFTSILKTNCYSYETYQLISGRNPQKIGECLASVYTGYQLGQTVSGTIVVGIYYGDEASIAAGCLFTKEDIIIENSVNGVPLWFMTKDLEGVNKSLPEELTLKNIYNSLIDPMREEQYVNLLVFGILALALMVTIGIFIYFVMRSRMISDIYPIGVYRSLGASRTKIFLQFISDIFVTITLTSLFGYLFTIIIFDTVAANINNTLSMNYLKSSYLYTFLGVLLLYAMNFLFGLLPIFLLMRKTPAEIISKYDI